MRGRNLNLNYALQSHLSLFIHKTRPKACSIRTSFHIPFTNTTKRRTQCRASATEYLRRIYSPAPCCQSFWPPGTSDAAAPQGDACTGWSIPRRYPSSCTDWETRSPCTRPAQCPSWTAWTCPRTPPRPSPICTQRRSWRCAVPDRASAEAARTALRPQPAARSSFRRTRSTTVATRIGRLSACWRCRWRSSQSAAVRRRSWVRRRRGPWIQSRQRRSSSRGGGAHVYGVSARPSAAGNEPCAMCSWGLWVQLGPWLGWIEQKI